MRKAEFTWTPKIGWVDLPDAEFNPDLVLFFGSRLVLSNFEVFKDLRQRFPEAIILGASGGGQIHRDGIIDEGVTGIGLKFESSMIKLAKAVANDSESSYDAGRILGSSLQSDNLVGIFVLSEGLKINGDQLINGLSTHVAPNTIICGGMAADDGRFQKTVLYANAEPMMGVVAAIGFYGHNLKLAFGHGGGWCPFGEEMDVTLSRNSVLFDLDGRSALEVYGAHMGETADQLPLSGLKFPLSIQDPARQLSPMVRTLLSIDREVGIMTFAGNVPEGWKARMMQATSTDLISAAATAAVSSKPSNNENIEYDSAAILISCIGRRLVLKEQSDSEISAVREILGAGTAITGFYSYGEFCTPELGDKALLFNQSMVVFSISETIQKSDAGAN